MRPILSLDEIPGNLMLEETKVGWSEDDWRVNGDVA